MTKVLSTDNAPFADTDPTRIWLWLGDDSKYRFDNIGWVGKGSPNPLFLHLAKWSECIDGGWTETEGETGEPVTVHDFDDQVGPIDGDNDEPDHLPKRDISADEWPTQDPGVLSYWWETSFPSE